MGNCVKCGAQLAEYSGELCANCQSSHAGSGAAGDVPCQRCGIYLPSYELQMMNSRLYCAYCRMDIQDEEDRHKKYAEKREPARAPEVPRGTGGAGMGGAGAGADGASPEFGKGTGGICERCGKESGHLYSISGRRLCEQCFTEESGKAPPEVGPTMFAQIVGRAKQALGMGKPRVLVAQSVKGRGLVFDVETRRMVERKIKPAEKKKS
ncbi:MAG: hypothetical protein WCT52_00360 [Candidatus Micrarchaeia archaeon]